MKAHQIAVLALAIGCTTHALPGSQLGDLVKAGGQMATSNLSSVTMLWDDCKKAKRVFESDPSVAAMLFTDEGCENTKIQVREGFTELPFYRKNRAEAVVVRPGCVCVGFDHGDKSGSAAVFDNSQERSKYLILSSLKDSQLDEALSAIDCKCGAAVQSNRSGPYVEQITSAQKDCGKNCRDRCNRFVGHFNRVDLPANKKVCAVVFDEHDCKDWSKPIMEGFESFSLVSKHRNDIGSVIVRPGCAFTGYDKTNKSGNRVLVGGTKIMTPFSSQALFKNLKGRNDLEDIISAVECRC